MRLRGIRCGQMQFDVAKRNSMRPSAIRSGQVQFDAAKRNLMQPSAIRYGQEAGPSRSSAQQEILVLASKFSWLRIMFCYHEANAMADSSAKDTATTQERLVSAPEFLLQALCKDQLGVATPRFIKMY
ncbi:hypothetical protein RHMOL_Rhmol04G0054000 [Rhododendron molle]|uniref:Uncharacterized protein n=1 Tax=Rhododendron molle TaxID=49168 RepID=A0ACC0NX82_RHOML|nr:hypothetical protein RHMOL_Rhmol04G0054000 [Rhododendron molle]